jgi:uncharacterized membrane protein
MKAYLLYSLAFLIGGNLYCAIELLYRARTHYSMFFCAGIAIVILLFVFQNNNLSPIAFGLVAAITITGLEFIFGVIFNIWLKMNVWDYSNTPMNLFGQICLPFSLIWFAFGIIIYYIFKLIKV